jgi:ribA/ribD-fused uncharacterized protein
MIQPESHEYYRNKSIVFRKTKDLYGGLSNMAAGFVLHVNDIRILTAEALYQACRFPHLLDVQRLILDQRSPLLAKNVGKPYRQHTRPDWEDVRVEIMRWCLRVKLAQNWECFGKLLLSTGDLPVVEESRRDDFWGARPVDDQRLVGRNVLGCLLVELRDQLAGSDRELWTVVDPLEIPDFLLMGRPIGALGCRRIT